MKRKPHNTLIRTVMAALFAALITVFTAYIGHIPLPGTGGYLHFGDSLVFLAACLLPKPYAMAAAALGGGLADLLTFPSYAIPTLLIKACIAACFSARREKILCLPNFLALLPAAVLTLGGYFLAEGIIFSWEAALVQSLTGNLLQSIGSAAVFLLLGLALDKIHLKAKWNAYFL